MRRRRDVVAFIVWFVVLSVTLGWLSWKATAAARSTTVNVMLVVPVVSAMLAAQGFSWKRKLTYVAVTLGAYVLIGLAYDLLGLGDIAVRQATANASLPSIILMFYQVFVTAFPLAMLVLFVGRTPALLWSRVSD